MEETFSNFLFPRVTIIGLGLIGSSIARAMRETRLAQTIVGCDTSENALVYGRMQKFIDHGTHDAMNSVVDSQLIILAAPPSALGEIARQIAPALAPGAIVMDTASVKQPAMEAISAHLPMQVDFIPAHPIAGSEQSGVRAGRADLFRKKRVILTPAEPLPTVIMQTITQFWNRMGARVDAMPAELHDQVYAYVSHLPQLLSYAAASTLGIGDSQPFLRLAKSDPMLWLDIFSLNKNYLLQALDDYLNIATHIENELLEAPTLNDVDSEKEEAFARAQLFPRVASACLISTVMAAEKKLGFSLARYAGSGFADFASPAAGEPQAEIETIARQHRAVFLLLSDYVRRLKEFHALISNGRWGELLQSLND